MPVYAFYISVSVGSTAVRIRIALQKFNRIIGFLLSDFMPIMTILLKALISFGPGLFLFEHECFSLVKTMLDKWDFTQRLFPLKWTALVQCDGIHLDKKNGEEKVQINLGH